MIGKNLFSRALAPMLLLGVLLSCGRSGSNTPAMRDDPAVRLRAIPAANPEKYRAKMELQRWKNPYLMVREDGIGLLDLSNNEIHILKPDDVPAALAALPVAAWPYGRVVAIQESGSAGASDASKMQMRKNRALLAGTLEGLEVAINWVPSA